MLDTKYTQEIKKGYLNEDGIVKLDFVDGFPQELAKHFGNTNPVLSTSQSRSIFDKVNALNTQLLGGRTSFAEIKIELAALKSRVKDKVEKLALPEDFYEFLNLNISAVTDEKTLKAFTLHFECVCNYLKDKKAQNNQQNNQQGFQKPNNNGYNNGNKPNNYNKK